jgi:glycolate oxidase FAD binding subunit
LPRPEHVATVLLCGLAPEAAVRAMSQALASPHDVSAAAYLPAGAMAAGTTEAVALRVEGPEPSVAFRRERLLAELAANCESLALEGDAATALWRAVRDVEPFAAAAERAAWRVSVAPGRGVEVAEAIARGLDAVWYLDWGGGLVWLAVASAEDGGAKVIRTAIRGADGRGTGHATLIRGSAALRRAVPVFEPQPPALAALAARVKESFDPRHILNPGRMIERS